MEAKTVKYIKLPGSGYRSAGSPLVRFALFFVIGFFVLLLRGKRVQLYLGDDHLLVVDSDGYSEDYKRFYWRDIQGFALRRTMEGRMINVAFALPFILFTALALSAKDGGSVFALGFVAAIFLLFLLINLAQGPTCDVELFTAVQSEKLPTLGRVKVANKVLARLQPIIVEAQGELKAEEMTQAPNAGSSFTEGGANISKAPDQPIIETYRGKTHSILSWVAFADVPGTFLTVLIGEQFIRAYSLLHIGAIVVLSIIALNKQKNTTLPAGLKRLPMVILAGVIVCFIASFAFGMYFAITDPGSVAAMRENIFGATWQVVLTVISTSINGFAGVYGIVKWRSYKESLVEVVPPPLVVSESNENPDQSV